MSKFEDKYKLPDTTAIVLEDITFHVNLPTSANRRFERAVASSMTQRDPNTGQFAVKEFDVEEVIVSQHKSFLRTCVVSVDGMSFDPDEFYKRWPDAAEDLYEKATSLAAETEVAAVESVGKLPATSGGKSIGKEEKTSMTDLQKQAS